MLQKFIGRECISVSSNIIEEAYRDDSDSLELLERAYKDLGKVTDMLDFSKDINFKESVLSYLDNSQKNTKGIPSSLGKGQL